MSNRERALELHSSGVPVSEIVQELGITKQAVYGYLREAGVSKKASTLAPTSSGDLEVQLLRIQLEAVTKERDLYKAEVARLRALVETVAL